MSDITIVADVGSTHCGRRAYALEAIRVAKEAGCDYVKFQLFEEGSNHEKRNYRLPAEWWPELWEEGRRLNIPVAASVFDDVSLEVLLKKPIPFLKLAHSVGYRDEWVRRAELMNEKKGGKGRGNLKIVVTTDFMGLTSVPEWCIKLYTTTTHGITEYPAEKAIACVPDIVDRFDGFSCHYPHKSALNVCQCFAGHGLKWFEVHMTLDHNDIDCPDHAFALKPKELEELVRVVK